MAEISSNGRWDQSVTSRARYIAVNRARVPLGCGTAVFHSYFDLKK